MFLAPFLQAFGASVIWRRSAAVVATAAWLVRYSGVAFFHSFQRVGNKVAAFFRFLYKKAYSLRCSLPPTVFDVIGVAVINPFAYSA